MLTPADIEQKTFSTALRGYDLDEVDDFLDEIVATMRELNDQLESARAAATAQPAAPPTTIPQPVSEPEPAAPPIDESAIGRALVAAQAAADKLVEDAQSEAARMLESARSEVEEWSAEREAKQREAEAEVAAFASRIASIRSELSMLASEVAGNLDDMDAVLAGGIEPDVGVPIDEPGDDASTVDVAEDTDEVVRGDDAGAGLEAVDLGVDEPDHLDDALTGVASDLQLDTGDDNAGFDVAAFEPHHSPHQPPDEEE